MDFSITPDQRLMQESLTRTLADTSSLERVRAFAADRGDSGADIWGTLAEFGLPGVVIAEEHGGLGLKLLDAALAAEALGRSVAPAPLLATVVASLAIQQGGTGAQQAKWLPRLAAGELVAGLAIAEPIAGARDGAGITAAGGKLTGTALFVTDALTADVFVVADQAGGVHLLAGDAPGVSRAPMTSIDLTRPLGELRLEGAPAEPLSGDLLPRLRDAAWTLLAADTLGAAEVMIEKAVAYAKERRQFGRVIGSFQAVKHMCAEMAAELEPCRALVWYAAYAFDEAPEEASLTAAHAKAHLSEVGRFVARTATEVHGGMGITDLLGLHYWFKRIGQSRQLLGGPERVRRIAAQIQGLAA